LETSQSSEPALPNEAFKELKAIYTTFIAPNSEFEVNLTSTCRQTIATRIHYSNPGIDILDNAEREICQLVYHSIYPRYLEYKKRRVSLPNSINASMRASQRTSL
jgi:hypothetical protein